MRQHYKAVFLSECGLTDSVLAEQLVGLCTDGASCMLGQFSGVAKLMKEKCPLLHSIHCMAHRLELATKNAVDNVNEVSHFRSFIDELYKIYSMSPKNQAELQCIADTLAIELMKVKKVFDLRWVFSSFVAVRSVLRDYPALFKHFLTLSEQSQSSRSSKEKSKFKGLAKKLRSWFLLSETCMLKDTLRVLKQLSLYLQKNEAHVMSAMDHIDSAKEQLLALKVQPGKTLAKFWRSYENDGKFKDVDIVQTDNDLQKFSSFRAQFLQALYDNLCQRFPCTDVLSAARALCPQSWPSDVLERALFGQSDIAFLCKAFLLDSDLSADVMLQFTIYKRQGVPGAQLSKLIKLLEVLPISSAECERGFSQMNLYHTAPRNRLLTDSVSDLMMVGINGPPLKHWNAVKYVVSWLQSGKHGALDTPTGVPKKPITMHKSHQLFL